MTGTLGCTGDGTETLGSTGGGTVAEAALKTKIR